MLSTEKPPSDPHLNTDDDKIKTSSSQIEVVGDLFKSDNPPPKFSIRDYVCCARNKDIASNWPFSEKNFQLCQKHGVTNLLPPFQPLDSVKNQFVKGCTVYHNLLDQEILSNLDGKTTKQSHQYESIYAIGARCNQKLNSSHLHITLSVSNQEEREVPSEVEQSHSIKGSEAAILLDSSTKQVKVLTLPKTYKTDTVKKSRLVAKLGTFAGPSTKEDNMANNLMVSEIMASKVCPVCKTFSSSSNTTLNAHIDQCLSGESALKWSADPKVIKHRIKSRKTRLMEDIYATAKHCTLEDLDRRNGTNWAMNPTPLDQSNELCVKKRVETMPSGGVVETGHEEGEVYIDRNGTKVRILSPFSEAANVEGNSRAEKGDKGSKFIDKKKKPHVQKHQKFLKLAPHGKPCSSKPDLSFETRAGSSRNFAVDQRGEKEVQLGQHSKAQEQIKLDDSGIIRRWVGSKRTALTRKTPRQDNHQHSGHNLRNSVGDRDRSSLANSYAGTNCLLTKPSFKNLVSSQSSKSMETSLNEPGIGLFREQPPLERKREGKEFPYLKSEGVGLGKRSVMLPKHKKLRREVAFVHDSCNSSLNHAATGVSSWSNKAVEINAAPARASDDTFVFASKSSCSHQVFSSKETKFTSTRKKHLLTNQGIVPKPRSDVKRKGSAPMRSQVNSKLEINNDYAMRLSQNDDDDQQVDSTQDFTDEQSKMKDFTVKMSHRRTRVLRKRNNRGAIKDSRKEEATDGLQNSPSEPHYYGHGVVETNEFSPVNFDRSLDNSEDSFHGEESESEDTLVLGQHVIETASKGGIDGSFISSGNSLDPEFHELPRSPGESKSERCAEVNQQHLCGIPVSPSTGGEQELFSADRVGHIMIGEDIHMEAELDSKDEQVNYFSVVDPIPIPGPPGSFLPSPRHMGSNDLQGNSSLTTCRVQFAEDQHDLVDRDKSDSPISAISDISNPALAMSESRSSKNLFVEALAVENETRKGFSGAAHVSQAANLGAERPKLDTPSINLIFPENAPVSLNFEQLCCCSRKEGAQGVALNFQESQLLRRRTTSLPFPEKNLENDCNERVSNINSRIETFSPSNYPNSGPEKVIYPTWKLASKHIEKKFSGGHEVKFPSQRDHDLSSPSASNSILRLMGKNLMVVNKDEDVSLQHRQQQSSSINAHPHLQSSTVSGFSPGGVGSKDYHSYHQVVANGPIDFSHDRRQDVIGQQFDAKFSCNSEGYVDVKTQPTPFHASRVNPSMDAAGACKSSLGRYLSREEQRPKNRLDNPLTYGLEKMVATSGRSWGVDSTSSKEIINIDDATAIEADSAIGMMCNEEMRSRVSSYGNSVPGASHEFSSRFVNPFYSNPLEGASSFYGRVLHKSFQLPISEGTNASPMKWNCNPEGPSLLSPSSLGTPSSSAGHLRPTFYYSPSFI